jgi:hypothetical protein
LLTGFLAAACLTSFGFHIVISTQLSFAATVHAFSLNRAQVVVAFTMGAVGACRFNFPPSLLFEANIFLSSGCWDCGVASFLSASGRKIDI